MPTSVWDRTGSSRGARRSLAPARQRRAGIVVPDDTRGKTERHLEAEVERTNDVPDGLLTGRPRKGPGHGRGTMVRIAAERGMGFIERRQSVEARVGRVGRVRAQESSPWSTSPQR